MLCICTYLPRLHSVNASLKYIKTDDGVYFKASSIIITLSMMVYLAFFVMYYSQGWSIGSIFDTCSHGEAGNQSWPIPKAFQIFGILVTVLTFLSALADVKLTLTLRNSIFPAAGFEDANPGPSDMAESVQVSMKIPIRATFLSSCLTILWIFTSTIMGVSSISVASKR